MSKTEIFQKVLKAVSEETELSEEEILGDRKTTEIVDARYIVVKTLFKIGLYPTQIASLMERSQQSINSILRNFEIREKQGGRQFAVIMQRVHRSLDIK